MRLLRTGPFEPGREKLELVEFQWPIQVPPYAILSHTWTDDEVLYKDVQAKDVANKKGFIKLKNSFDQARRDGWQYLWA